MSKAKQRKKEDGSYWALLEMVCLLSVNCIGHWLGMPVQLYLCGCWLLAAGGWLLSCAATACARGAWTPSQMCACLCGYVFCSLDQPAAVVISLLVSIKLGRPYLPRAGELCQQGYWGHRLGHPTTLIPCNPKCDSVPELSATKEIRASVTCQCVQLKKTTVLNKTTFSAFRVFPLREFWETLIP